MNFDWRHALFKSFDGIIADPSGGGIRKKSKAKKFADFGLHFHHLNSLFDTQGEEGLLTILANPPTKSIRVRGSVDLLTLHVIIIIRGEDHAIKTSSFCRKYLSEWVSRENCDFGIRCCE